jgi:hypothetical protein
MCVWTSLKVRKHVYNCNRLFKAADPINVDVISTENMYSVHLYTVQYIRARMRRSGMSLLEEECCCCCRLYIKIFT